jgi:hypothetical protein
LPYDPSWRFPLRWFQVGKLDSVELTGETAASSSNYPWDITFKPRTAINRQRKLFTSFSPAVGDKAAKAMRHEIRGWGLDRLSRYSLGELRERLRPKLGGWVRYYGLFHPSTLQCALRTLDDHLVRWAQRKYKRLHGHITRAWTWLNELKRRAPMLFPHWHVAAHTTER